MANFARNSVFSAVRVFGSCPAIENPPRAILNFRAKCLVHEQTPRGSNRWRRSSKPVTSGQPTDGVVPSGERDSVRPPVTLGLFQNEDTSQPILARISKRLSRGLKTALPALLAESPDPDAAVILFERLIGSPGNTSADRTSPRVGALRNCRLWPQPLLGRDLSPEFRPVGLASAREESRPQPLPRGVSRSSGALPLPVF